MPVCVTAIQLRSLLSGSVLGASASANDNDPPADTEPASDGPAEPIDAAASPAPSASDEPPAKPPSQPAPDVITPAANDNDAAVSNPANDNAPHRQLRQSSPLSPLTPMMGARRAYN